MRGATTPRLAERPPRNGCGSTVGAWYADVVDHVQGAPPRRRWVPYVAGGVLGISLGAVTTWWILHRRTAPTPAPATSEETKRQLELMVRLAETTGDFRFDPRWHPPQDVVREIQNAADLAPVDGLWNAAVERAVFDMLGERTPSKNPVTVPDPRHELEPDENWEATYAERFGDALARCCELDEVVAFDQAVVVLLETVFPDHGSFCLAPGTGAWKKLARERARHDLARVIGPTEVEARARLVATVGRRALDDGADLGQAVRLMAERAWPTTRWDTAHHQPWQEAFVRAAAGSLQTPVGGLA